MPLIFYGLGSTNGFIHVTLDCQNERSDRIITLSSRLALFNLYQISVKDRGVLQRLGLYSYNLVHIDPLAQCLVNNREAFILPA